MSMIIQTMGTIVAEEMIAYKQFDNYSDGSLECKVEFTDRLLQSSFLEQEWLENVWTVKEAL